jgi:hypothetical protein
MSQKVETNRSTFNSSLMLASDHQNPSQALVPPKGPAKFQLRTSSSPLPSTTLITQDHHGHSLQVFDQSLVSSPVNEGSDVIYPSPPASVCHFSYPGRPMLPPRHTRVKSYSSAQDTSQPSPASSIYSYNTAYSSKGFSSKPLYPSPTTSVPNFSYPSPTASVRHFSCPGLTMLAPRNTRVKRYPSAQNNTRSSPGSSICFSDATYPHHGLGSGEDDTMPLSTRRSIIQIQRRAASYDIPRLSSNNQFFNSHQPQQFNMYNPRKREAMLAEWRESLRWDQAARSNRWDPRVAVDRRGAEIFSEQRLEWKQKSLMEKYRDEVMERAMMSGELEERHREAMSRMQALANMRA